MLLYVVLLYASENFLSRRFKPNLNYSIGHNYLRLEEVKKTHDVDLLFLGSSHAYRGFDTRIFKEAGYKVFNLGSSSQTPTQTLVLLERYLDQLKPKLVVLEVFPLVFTSDGVESTLDLIANDKNDLNSLNMVVNVKNMKAFNTFMYAISKGLMDSVPDFKLKTYHSGGYVSRTSLKYNNDVKPHDSKLIFKKQQLKNFETILNRLKRKKIEYVLVQAPITSQMYRSFVNIDEFNNKMAAYGNYYNFNTQLKLNDTLDFFDNHHLNQNGVTIFNIEFLELLDKNYNTLLKQPH
jgi:hypothetical protein